MASCSSPLFHVVEYARRRRTVAVGLQIAVLVAILAGEGCAAAPGRWQSSAAAGRQAGSQLSRCHRIDSSPAVSGWRRTRCPGHCRIGSPQRRREHGFRFLPRAMSGEHVARVFGCSNCVALTFRPLRGRERARMLSTSGAAPCARFVRRVGALVDQSAFTPAQPRCSTRRAVGSRAAVMIAEFHAQLIGLEPRLSVKSRATAEG